MLRSIPTSFGKRTNVIFAAYSIKATVSGEFYLRYFQNYPRVPENPNNANKKKRRRYLQLKILPQMSTTPVEN